MPQGTIKKLVSESWFWVHLRCNSDVFFHHTSVVDQKFDELKEGQAVTYELVTARMSEAATKALAPRT